MAMGVWLPLLCVLAVLAASTSGDQCHNSACTQTNFRDYSHCIQTSCNNNCQCSNVRCNSCQTSDQCCQRCCQATNYVQSSCTNNCQGSNCQSSNCQTNNCQSSNCQTNNCQSSNCQTKCQTTERIRTCADINCRTCRGEECMGCCEFRTTTEQSGEPNTRPPVFRPPPPPPPPPPPTTCNVTNVFKPTIPMPNITITINQPPIHITTGPVMSNISVPCPSQGSLTCPVHNNTIVVIQSNATNCCNISSTRCVPTANPATPYCYNSPQQACGSACLAQPPQYIPQPPPQYIAPPPQYIAPPPQYIAPPPQYIAPPPQYIAPPPQPPPRYVVPYVQPQPVYISQPAPVQCPVTGCPIAAPQPQYVRMPAPQYVQMPAPQYVQMPAPQYVQMPAPQYVPMPAPQCPASGCPVAAQPYYTSYVPPSSPGGCVGQYPYTRCSVMGAGGYYTGTGGNMAAVPLPGAVLPYSYNVPAGGYAQQQYSVQPNGSYVLVASGQSSAAMLDEAGNVRRRIGTLKSGDDDTAAEYDEEDSNE